MQNSYLKFLFLTVLVTFSFSALAQELCEDLSLSNSFDLKSISNFIDNPKNQKNIVGIQTINGDSLKEGTIIESPKDTNLEIKYEQPFKISFELSPNTRVQIIERPVAQKTTTTGSKTQQEKICGPKLKILEGEITSFGDHQKSKNCDFELETPLFYINPIGTKYSSRLDLSEAIAELNGENQEEVEVHEGTIELKLVKVSKRSKIKRSVAKNQNSAKSRSRKNTVVAGTVKSIKVSPSSRIKAKSKVVKNKRGQKEMLADIEILDPFD